jgi:hypothetical protein
VLPAHTPSKHNATERRSVMSKDIYTLIEKYSSIDISQYLPDLSDIEPIEIDYDDIDVEDEKLQGWGGVTPTSFKKGNIPWNKGKSGLQDLTNLQKARERYQRDWHQHNVKKIRVGTWSPPADNTSSLNKKMLECPHCNKTGNYGNMKRWHFENCKWK